MPWRCGVLFAIALTCCLAASCSQDIPVVAGQFRAPSTLIHEDRLIRLDGTWGFTWNQDRTADADERPDTQIKIPSYWHDAPGHQWPVIGAATYSLDLQLPDPQVSWSLYLPDVNSSWTLSADGVILARSGFASTDPRSYRSFVRPRTVVLPSGRSRVHLAIYVVNLADRIAGIRSSILFGRTDVVSRYLERTHLESSFFVGGLTVMLLFNLTIFLLQPRRGANLWLALFSFFVAVRTFLTGPRMVYAVFPDLPMELTSKIEYVAIFGAVISFIFYMRYVFPDWWPRRLYVPYVGYNLLFVVLAVPLPMATLASTVITYYDITLALFAVSVVTVSVWALVKKHEDGLLFFVGLLLLSLGTLNDLAYQFVALPWGYVLGELLFVFMFFHTFLLSRQLAKDHELTQRQSAELRKLDKLKDDFLARVTHELRTPVHGMVGILDAFRLGDYGPLTDRQSYHIGLLTSSGKRLLTLVNSILDFNQLRQHGARWERHPVDLKRLVDFLLPSLYPNVKAGVGLFNHMSDQVPPALGDEIKLEQVFQQLLLNAVQHTAHGSVTVEAEVIGQEILIAIRDTGSGIPKGTLEQLFSPFHQAAEIDTRASGGLGLGLSMSRQILLQMGGRLEVVSEEGLGTTARVTLPVCPPSRREYFERDRIDRPLNFRQESFAPPSGEPPVPEAARAETVSRGPTVLIVDDEPVNLLVLRTFLVRAGYHVLEAGSGADALKMVHSQTVHLVILDIMMPQMSGYDVCEHLRTKYTEAELPIILLTAKNQVDDLIRGYRCGASDFLTKPFQREELKARMDLHLKVSHLARDVRSASKL